MVPTQSKLLFVASALFFRAEAWTQWLTASQNVGHRRDESALLQPSRRATPGYLSLDLVNYHAGYGVNISLGHPSQPLTVLLTTVSLGSWVNPECSSAIAVDRDTYPSSLSGLDGPLSDPATCKQRGTYNPEKSDRSTPQASTTDLSYDGRTNISYHDYQDDLTWAGITLQNWTFGVATDSVNAAIGMIDLGRSSPDFDESFSRADTPRNYSVIKMMAAQGIISSPAFSLSLGDDNIPNGSLVFGGVDKAKYTGPLVKVPIENTTYFTSNGYNFTSYDYTVTASSISFTPPGSKSPSKNYTLPDNGTYSGTVDTAFNGIVLPWGLSSQLCSDLGGKNNSDSCSVDCELRKKTGGLTFGFAGQSITVTYPNLVTVQPGSDNKNCTINVIDDGSSRRIPSTHALGLPFLRSAYAVFDLDNLHIHLAQAANCGSNIVSIGKGPDSVPAAKGDCATSAAAHDSLYSIQLMVVAILVATASLF